MMKGKAMCVFLSVILVFGVFALTACGGTQDIPDDDIITVVSFNSVVTQPKKTEYYEGEIFNINGLVASVNLSNSKTRKYYSTEFKEWTHKDEPLTTDITKITVTIPETEITFDVDIEVNPLPHVISSVKEIKTMPRADYLEQDVFDISGLVVTVNMMDGGTEDISWEDFTDWTHKGEKLTTGVKYIRALVPGAADPTLFVEIPITVGMRAIYVTSATVKKQPTVTNYFTGENFDISGIEVGVTYSYPDGATDTYTAEKFPEWTYDAEPLKKGTTEMTVTVPHYNVKGDEKTVKVPITVSDYEELNVTAVNGIEQMPTVTGYKPGDTFNASGLSVTVTLSNNREWTIAYDDDPTAFVIPTDKLTLDTEYVEVGFAKAANESVTVRVPVEVTSSLTLTTNLEDYYLNNEPINFANAITVRWVQDGVATVVPADEWSLFDGDTEIEDKTAATLTKIGTHTLTVRYNDTEVTFDVVIKNANSVITPAIIEAEDNVFYKEDYTASTTKNPSFKVTKDQPYTTMEATSVTQYFDPETGAKTNGARIPSGASGRGAVSSLSLKAGANDPELPIVSTLVYFKFSVNVPEDGVYKLKARAQGVGTSNIKPTTFGININEKTGEDGELEYGNLNLSGNSTVQRGNQVADYVDLGGKSLDSWMGMIWWSVVDLGDYELTAGENTVCLVMNETVSFNIDYFEFSEGDTAGEVQLFSMRDKDASGARPRVDLGKNTIFLKQGENITDAAKNSATANKEAYDLLIYKPTLIYLRTESGESIPVADYMISGLNYDLVGVEQTVTVNVTKKNNTTPIATATFKVFIESN